MRTENGILTLFLNCLFLALFITILNEAFAKPVVTTISSCVKKKRERCLIEDRATFINGIIVRIERINHIKKTIKRVDADLRKGKAV